MLEMRSMAAVILPCAKHGGGGPAKLVEGATADTGASRRPLHRLRRSPSPVSRVRTTAPPVRLIAQRLSHKGAR
jgi:hypothetical protein